MLEMAAELSIHRHIGGLEKWSLCRLTHACIHRHIGGLENE